MSNPYVGEIRMFAGNFAPVGWMPCNGQLLSIATNSALFNLFGTTYGGDGQVSFQLPDLRARVPIHMGTGRSGSTYVLGQNGGTPSVALSSQQIPNHTHTIVADGDPGTTADPMNAYPANADPTELYSPYGSTPHPPLLRALNPAMLPNQGGSQPHDNMQPFLAITYIISAYGTYPTQ